MPRHRKTVPFPAAVVSHPSGTDNHADADAALHEKEEEDEGKTRSTFTTTTTTITADSEQEDDDDDDDDEWDVPSSRHRHQRWQHPSTASVKSSANVRSTQSREDEVNAYEYRHVMLEQREIGERLSTEDHQFAGSHAQQVRVRNPGDSMDNRHHDNDNDNRDAHHWSCPRCTLHNPAAATACVACNFKHQQTTTTAATATTTASRSADSVRRERLFPQQQQRYRSAENHRSRQSPLLAALVQSDTNTNTSTRNSTSHAVATSTFARPNSQSQPQQESQQHHHSQPQVQQQQPQLQQSQQGLYHNTTLAHLIFSGALVGSFLGVAGAYLQGGENAYPYMFTYPSMVGVTSSTTRTQLFWTIVLEAALLGAIAGTVVHNVLLEQQRAITRAHSGSTSSNVNSNSSTSNVNNNNNNNNNNRSQDSDDPMVAFIMRSMETSSRLSRQAIVDGNASSSSSSMTSYDYFLLSTEGSGGGNGNGRLRTTEHEHEHARAGTEHDIYSLPTVMTVPGVDPDQLPEDCRRCAICLDAFLPGSLRKTLPCWHGFHDVCVDQWLRTNGACPLCKHRIDG